MPGSGTVPTINRGIYATPLITEESVENLQKIARRDDKSSHFNAEPVEKEKQSDARMGTLLTS